MFNLIFVQKYYLGITCYNIVSLERDGSAVPSRIGVKFYPQKPTFGGIKLFVGRFCDFYNNGYKIIFTITDIRY